jgi:hypothetical protein
MNASSYPVKDSLIALFVKVITVTEFSLFCCLQQNNITTKQQSNKIT